MKRIQSGRISTLDQLSKTKLANSDPGMRSWACVMLRRGEASHTATERRMWCTKKDRAAQHHVIARSVTTKLRTAVTGHAIKLHAAVIILNLLASFTPRPLYPWEETALRT